MIASHKTHCVHLALKWSGLLIHVGHVTYINYHLGVDSSNHSCEKLKLFHYSITINMVGVVVWWLSWLYPYWIVWYMEYYDLHFLSTKTLLLNTCLLVGLLKQLLKTPLFIRYNFSFIMLKSIELGTSDIFPANFVTCSTNQLGNLFGKEIVN
jgi:hypothetical protein